MKARCVRVVFLSLALLLGLPSGTDQPVSGQAAVGSTVSDGDGARLARSYVVERNLGGTGAEVLCYGFPGMGFSEACASTPINAIPYDEFVLDDNGLPATVQLRPQDPNQTAATTVRISYRAAQSQQEVLDAMGFSASLAARYKMVKGSSSFSQRVSSLHSERSISICMTASVTFGLEVPKKSKPDMTLSDAANRLLQDNERAFYDKYGTHFVAQAERGARIVVVFKCEATSDESYREMKATAGLRASTPLAQVDAKAAITRLHRESKKGWSISFEVFGANVDFDEVRKSAKSFLALADPNVSVLEDGCSGLLKAINYETADYVTFHVRPHVIPNARFSFGTDDLWSALLRADEEADRRVAVSRAFMTSSELRQVAGEAALPFDPADQLNQALEYKQNLKDVATLAAGGNHVRITSIPSSATVSAEALEFASDPGHWSIADWIACSDPGCAAYLITQAEANTVHKLLDSIGADPGYLKRRQLQVLQELTKIDFGWTDECVRGNTPTTRRRDAVSLYPLLALPKLNRVDLRNCGSVLVPVAEAMAGAKWVDLDLSWNQISNVDGLSGLVGLQRLEIQGCRIESIGFVSALVSLRVLDASENYELSDYRMLGALAELEELDVSGTLFGPDERGLLAISTCKSLRALTMRLTRAFTRVEDLRGLEALKAIESLDLSYCGVSQSVGWSEALSCWNHDGLLARGSDNLSEIRAHGLCWAVWDRGEFRTLLLQHLRGEKDWSGGALAPAHHGNWPAEVFPSVCFGVLKRATPVSVTWANTVNYSGLSDKDARNAWMINEVTAMGLFSEVTSGVLRDSLWTDPFWKD